MAARSRKLSLALRHSRTEGEVRPPALAGMAPTAGDDANHKLDEE